MATILRDWSYRYQWLYDGISRLASLSVGGETRFRQLALQGLTINQNTQILDLVVAVVKLLIFWLNTPKMLRD